MKLKTDRRSRRSVKALKKAYVDLILAQEDKRISIQQIADQADYNRGTFYKHFTDKESLKERILTDFLGGIAVALLEPYKDSAYVDLQEQAPSTMRIFTHIYEERCVLKALRILYPDVAEKMLDVFVRCLSGEFYLETESPRIPVDYDLMIHFQMAATVGFIMHWADTDFKFSTLNLSEQFTELVRVRPYRLVNTMIEKGNDSQV
ncbi:DNA-binding transcriptional regulator, AcrR family [Terribacillus halophilus]|uniref:DNA-binding transcriptional regulator, AcrR family n=1 Tax=Terribacillus halophilus TaxID=361279 RepID=A0A1G6IES9_9BACI|nr:TetR/AcrR family transcriptional regulator [Terribacillus halophilus]SDC05052.1 DNA-binding transcriptional regulator, AcrR family [Terribacillus halophilus]